MKRNCARLVQVRAILFLAPRLGGPMNRRAVLRSASAAISFAVLPRLASAKTAPTSAFAQLRDRYFLQALKLNPVSATYLGGDGYSPELADINGRLRDYSPAALAREAAFYRQIL